MSENTKHTPGPFYLTHGIIFTTGDPYGHGQMRIADLRGWGHLTGQGACAFDNEKAAAIQDATGAFIVRACNSHDELLTALKWADKQLNALVSEDSGNGSFIRGTGTELAGFCIGREALRAAIAKAEGQ